MAQSFTITRRVQFAETDMAGVMHFANFFRWMEESEHAFFRSLGMSVMRQRDGKTFGWPRVRASCEYFGPVRFEDEVEIRIVITDISEKSITYEAIFSHAGQPKARGRIKMVCCRTNPDDGSFTAVAIPDDIRAKFQAFAS